MEKPFHALLHGFPSKLLKKRIIQGRSMGINSKKYKFYSSSIVGGGIPIGLGIAMANKLKNKSSMDIYRRYDIRDWYFS